MGMIRLHRHAAVALIMAAVLQTQSTFAAEAAAQDHGVDRPMASDPVLPTFPTFRVYAPEVQKLWIEALSRPEADVRLLAARAIAATASPDMRDNGELGTKLRSIVNNAKESRELRRLAAQSLVAFDSRGAEADLLAANKSGDEEIILLTDPCLAAWKNSEAQALWTARLQDKTAPSQTIRSAIQSLSHARTAAARQPLLAIAKDDSREMGVRLAAAQALAKLEPLNADELAAVEKLALIRDGGERLLAATILTAGKDAESQRLLMTLAHDRDPAIATIAAVRLFTIAPSALYPLAEEFRISNETPLRKIAMLVFQQRKGVEDTARIAGSLGDLSPSVRAAAREALIALDADAALHASVRSAAKAALDGIEWRSLEQAALVLGTLREESVAERLLELAVSKQTEVRVAALVALRRIDDPKTLPRQLVRARKLAALLQEAYRLGKTAEELAKSRASDEELAQLLQTFGLKRYAEAEPFLISCMAANSDVGEPSRAAAAWALGFLHAGGPDAATSTACQNVVKEQNERSLVRQMAAVTLGRMRDATAKALLKERAEKEANAVGEACRWAYAAMTGETLAPRPGVVSGGELLPFNPVGGTGK